MRELLRPRIAGIRAVNKPKFKVGDIANWTNDYGVDLGARTIVRVDADIWVVCYYVPPTDTPWMHIREKNLSLISASPYEDFGRF